MGAQRLDRGQARFAQRVERTGEQNRDRPGLCHRFNTALTRVLEMVGRQRPEFRRQLGAMLIGQLIGMELDRQSVLAGAGEHAPRLRG